MNIMEKSKVGEEILKNKNLENTIIVGLSIKNSYFNEENLKKNILFAKDKVKNVFIMIPDEPAVFTLKSIGYDEEKSKRKSRLESNRLENKCKKIILEERLDNIVIIRWDKIKENIFYKEQLKKIKDLYLKDVNFKKSINDTTKEVVLFNKTILELDKAVKIGVNFLFQELAFISASNNILGYQKSAYLYHSTMPVLKDIIDKRFENLNIGGIGFITAI